MVTLYVQLYKNRMIVRNLATQQQVSGHQPLATSASLLPTSFLQRNCSGI